MSATAAIIDRLDRIEILLAQLAGLPRQAGPQPVVQKDPYALAKSLAREGKQAESIAESKRVSREIMAAEKKAKEKQRALAA